MSLGNNIKIFRKKLGLTQEELASRLCVTSQAVSKWESEAGLPDTAQIVPLAKALNVSIDSLFGIDTDDYDRDLARKIIFEADSLRDNGSQKEGALAAADFLAEKCEENPFNYGIHMRYVQSVAHMSRFFSTENLSDEEAEKWRAYIKAAENRSLYIFRYSNDLELVDKCHYALAWIYWHNKEYAKGREHINKLPSISNNMLQETINSYYAYVEKGLDGWKASVRDNLQNFVRAVNKQFVYGAEGYMWKFPLEETVSYCEWALNVMEQFMKHEKMRAHCQGFYRDTVKYLAAAYLRNGKPKEAAAVWKNLMQKISEYVDFCDNIINKSETSAVSEFGEKAARNMNNYTKEFAESKKAFMLGQLKSWCGGKDFEEFEKLIKE
ncbi:MAG: helix-turn-helix transcriptional regulator [Spirochaetaceae bacterium]|nr:helix-turn-helix transcriptional regulator [Spirochaetaceae bacterium]